MLDALQYVDGVYVSIFFVTNLICCTSAFSVGRLAEFPTAATKVRTVLRWM